MIKVPSELVKRIAGGRGVLFVGAGLSQGAGLPGWPDLLREMLRWAKSHNVSLSDQEESELSKCITEGKLLLVAEEMREKLRKQPMQRFMAEVFRKPEIQPTPTHKLLPKIPFTAALTTNYDKLLETTYTLARGNAPYTFTHMDRSELTMAQSGGEFYIWKIHGTIDRIETLVFGEGDYREVMQTNPAYRQSLINLFSNNTVLFLGFGLTDPDLKLLLDELRIKSGGYSESHYALMDETKMGPIERGRFYKDYNIQIIPYRPSASDHPEVREFLTELAKEVTPRIHEAKDKREEPGVSLTPLPSTATDRKEYLEKLNQVLAGEAALFQIGLQTIMDRYRLSLLLEVCNRLDISSDSAEILVRSCAFYGVDAGCWFRRRRGGRFDLSDKRRDELTRNLVALLEQADNYDLRLAVIDALGEIRSHEAVGKLLDMIGHDRIQDLDRRTRRTVIKALGRIGSPQAIERLISVGLRGKGNTKIKKSWIRKRVHEWGWQNRGWRKAPDWGTRERCIWALGEMAVNKSARPELQKLAVPTLLNEILKNPRNAKLLRQRAAWALGQIGDRVSFKYLLDVVANESDPEIKKEARKAVERINRA